MSPASPRSRIPTPMPEAGRRRPWLRGPALRAGALVLVAGAVLFGSHGAAEAQTQTVSISISSSRIDEGGSATLTVNANPAFGSDKLVALTWDRASLVNGVIQGTGNTTSFTLTGGNTSRTFALTAPEDNVYVPEKEADLVAEIDGQHYTKPLRYVDNEGKPTVTISTSPADRVGEDETAVLVAELSHASAEAHKVGLTVLDPYDALTGTVPTEFDFTVCTFGPNCPKKTVRHTLTLDDNTLEDGTRPVNFALTVDDAAHATLGMPSTAILWVKDDDAPPSKPQNVVAVGGLNKVRLSWDEPEYTSGDRITKYQYRQSINDGVTWHLGWVDVLDGATVRELEITGLTGGIEHTFQVRAFSDDTGKRGDFSEVRATPFSLETVEGLGWNLVFSSPTIVEGGAGVTATISIDGDPLPGPVSLPIQVNELVDDNGVQRSEPLEGLDDGRLIDAVEGDDVVGVTFPAGARSMTLTLFVPVDDDAYTPPTLLEIAVLSPRTVMPGAMATSELSWRDNDPAPVATLAAGRTTVTEGEDVTLTATLAATGFAAALTEVLVDVEVDGVPLTSTSSVDPFEFAAGETTATLDFTTTEELTHSGERTVTIFLKPPRGAAYTLGDPSLVTVQVLDKPVPVVTVMADPTVTEGETITLTAVLSFGFDSPIEVDVDADDPYGALDGSPGTFSFAAGETTATIDVQTVDEMEHAGPGTVTLTLAEPTDGTYLLGDEATVSVRVLDNDAMPTAPRNLRAQARVDGVWLTWDAPDSSGDAKIDEYQFRVSRDGGRSWETKDPQWHFAGDADTRSHEVEFKEYRELTFQLAASNDTSGYGPWSSSATVTPVKAGSLEWRFRASSNIARRSFRTAGRAAVLIEGNTITGTLTIVEGAPFMKDQSIPVIHGHPAGPHLIRAADGSDPTVITLPAGHMSAGIELHVPDDELYWTPAHGPLANRSGNTSCVGCVPKAKRLHADVPGTTVDPYDFVVVLEDEEPPVISMSASAAPTVISEADMGLATDLTEMDLKYTVTLSHGFAEATTVQFVFEGGGYRYVTRETARCRGNSEGVPADQLAHA